MAVGVGNNDVFHFTILEDTMSEINQDEARSAKRKSLLLGGIVLVLILLVGLAFASGAFQSEEPSPETPTQSPTSLPTEEALQPEIRILEPVQGTTLDIAQPVKVAGEGQGLPEGNIVVQAVDPQGNLLVQEASILQGDNVGVGGKGTWQVSLNLDAVVPGTSGALVAFGTDPKTGDRVAETRIDVVFGEPVEAQIHIYEPQNGAVLDVNRPIEVKGEGQGLFEGNVVVQAVDAQGYVWQEVATTLQGEQVGLGGKGDWSVTLDLQQVPRGSQGAILAFGTDPKTGSRVAETRVDVVFGEPLEAQIQILEPSNGAVLDVTQPIEVKGQGQGLFEGNVAVQAIDENGAVLADANTILQGENVGVGGRGDWRVSLDLRNVAVGTPGQIVAFGIDPKTGARVAQTQVDVTFGEEVAQAPSTLEGPLWVLTLIAGKQPLEGAPIYASFEDGKVSGSAGCNTYQGSYQSDADTLEVTPLALTRKLCPEPAGVMEQEQTFVSLLQSAKRYSTDNGLLTIFDHQGSAILTFSPAVAGMLNFRVRLALPETAQVIVTLEDVSKADAEAETIGQSIMKAPVGPPIPFAVMYNLKDIDPNRRYGVRAQIVDADGTLLFTSTQSYPVLTQGNPSYVEIELTQP